jgi:hypothetical protein
LTGVGYQDVAASEAIEVAEWIAPRLHPFGQDVGSVIPTGFAAYAGINNDWREGALSPARGGELARVLEGHTSTPSLCWLCLWNGYGYLHEGGIAWLTASDAPKKRRPPRFQLSFGRRSAPKDGRALVMLPNREYLLYQGTVAQAAGWEDGPNLWWPDDRAWCVASEIDLTTTYVGGTIELIDAILGSRELEASRVTPDDSWPR